ncbi:ATP-binding protein [Nocardia altamirensis]|uniref:ATP-binding protein n=1 Tax=Nocardia altamirensis TaxID=472158 RepID=UPI0008406C56|nr:ATP-binding protein [Nocardia altamirensis]
MTSTAPSLLTRATSFRPNHWLQGSTALRAAAECVDRMLAFALGLGTWIFGAGNAAEIARQSHHFAAWWTMLTLAGVFGTALLLATTALQVTLPTVRKIATAHAAVFAIAIALSGFAVAPGQITDDVAWVYRLVPLAGVAATLVWRTPAMSSYLVGVGLLAAASTGQATGDTSWTEFALTAVRILGTSAAFVYLTELTQRAARLLDAERARAHPQDELAAEARASERARFAGMIHDKVLATLLDAARGGDATMLARQAETALGQFAVLGRVSELCTDVEAIEAITREVAGATETELRVRVRRDYRSDDLCIDSLAVAALAQAAAEAVRNSVRHAAVPGRVVAREVTIVARARGITVVVRDDGAGFDPGRAAGDRLGLTVSIRQRMREAGGRAIIDSRPGAGTRVTLEWTVPDDS